MTFKPTINSLDSRSKLASAAAEVLVAMSHQAGADRNAEWQRVHSAIADLTKDISMSYAKLARLEADFSADELGELEKVGEQILAVADQLSIFLKAFYEGRANMDQGTISYGPQGGAPQQMQAPQPAPQQDVPLDFEDPSGGSGDLDLEAEAEAAKGEGESEEKDEKDET